MQEWINTILFGIVEGITEFLPISSTGHLLLMAHFMNDHRSEFFNVGIQAGAVLAVVVIYWRKLLDLLLHWKKRQQFTYICKLGVCFIVTVTLGLACRKLGFELPEDPAPVTWAVLIGAFFIFFAEWRLSDKEVSETVTWKIAVVIGVAQVLAGIFPGTSRSMATIMAAMFMGLSRMQATEFSFLVGIPTMFAATFYTLADEWMTQGSLPLDEMDHFAVGFIVSTAVAFIAVKWLLNFLRSNTFIPFAWYRLGLGIVLLGWLYLWSG